MLSAKHLRCNENSLHAAGEFTEEI